MFSSHSVIRRYTPPTCTLEILAKTSPLSRWAGRTLLKELRFKLSFDDPRIIQEQAVVISGDREQLEMLCDTITSYVKDFLQQSFEQLSSTAKIQSSVESNNHNSNQNSTEIGDRAIIDSTSQLKNNNAIVKSCGMLNHELFFGSLASPNSAPKVKLSATQLFDLANVLDRYRNEIEALPDLNTGGSLKSGLASGKIGMPIWGSAAVILLAIVGLTSTKLGIFSQKSSQTNNSIASNSEVNNSTTPEIVAPQPSKNTPMPSPKVPETLASAERLPPPPPVDLPKPPPPNIPDFSKYPIPSAGFDLAKLSPPNIPNAPNSVNKQPSVQTPVLGEKVNNNGNSETIKLPELPSLVPQSPNSNSDRVTPTEYNRNADAKDANVSDAESKLSNESDRVKLTATNSNTKKTLDRLPQLVEIKDYFQKRWQPPEELTQAIEYRLMLNNNGSIKSIIPLGKTSEIYLDRTNIPLMGESFISSFDKQATPIVRLIFSPDGTVKTFQE
jgi:Domain of unknown function (DUF4335)